MILLYSLGNSYVQLITKYHRFYPPMCLANRFVQNQVLICNIKMLINCASVHLLLHQVSVGVFISYPLPVHGALSAHVCFAHFSEVYVTRVAL